jgi:hypothetical protein
MKGLVLDDGVDTEAVDVLVVALVEVKVGTTVDLLVVAATGAVGDEETGKH